MSQERKVTRVDVTRMAPEQIRAAIKRFKKSKGSIELVPPYRESRWSWLVFSLILAGILAATAVTIVVTR